MIAELEFRKVDVAIHENGPHLRPSQVLADVGLAQQIRIGPTLTSAAFSIEIARRRSGILPPTQGDLPVGAIVGRLGLTILRRPPARESTTRFAA